MSIFFLFLMNYYDVCWWSDGIDGVQSFYFMHKSNTSKTQILFLFFYKSINKTKHTFSFSFSFFFFAFWSFLNILPSFQEWFHKKRYGNGSKQDDTIWFSKNNMTYPRVSQSSHIKKKRQRMSAIKKCLKRYQRVMLKREVKHDKQRIWKEKRAVRCKDDHSGHESKSIFIAK